MKAHFFNFLPLYFFVSLFPLEVIAGQVDVVDVNLTKKGQHQYHFDVTLQHEDAGWEHYANRWEILDMDGHILATRTLHHPHVNEQPFTRSLTTTLPDYTKPVLIRGHDSVHGYDGKEMKVSLP